MGFLYLYIFSIVTLALMTLALTLIVCSIVITFRILTHDFNARPAMDYIIRENLIIGISFEAFDAAKIYWCEEYQANVESRRMYDMYPKPPWYQIDPIY